MDQKQHDLYGPYVKPNKIVTWDDIESDIYDGIEGIEEFISVIGLAESKHNEEPSKNAISYVESTAKICFEYALEGKRPKATTSTDLIGDPLLTFASFTRVARITTEAHTLGGVPTACEKLIIMAMLRSQLDEYTLGLPDFSVLCVSTRLFTLFEIAVLAQMNEKSVRNATQPNANDRLETIRVGTRTMVEPEVALQWLSNRRSFTPTQIINGGDS